MKIVLTGGGTGGHIIPNIALLPNLKKYFDEIIYIGSETGMEKTLLKPYGITFFSVDCVKFDRSRLFKNLKIPFLLSRSVRKARALLNEINPNVVFAKGGFVSLPVCLAAYKEKIPFAIHESDYTFGLANKLLLKKANIVMTNFDMNNTKYLHVGMPLRDELFKFNKSHFTRPVILFIGGSSGAKFINDLVRQSIEKLTEKYYVVHVCGKGNSIKYNNQYYKQIEYTNSIGKLYVDADAVVARAGATVAAELMALDKKTVFIPLEKRASRGDQILNARYYEKLNLAFVLREKYANTNTLVTTIEKALETQRPNTSEHNSANEIIVTRLYNIAKK